MSLKRIIIVVLVLPLAELVLFIVVAAEIGLLRAVGLQFAISIAGLLVLRQVGSARLSRLKAGLMAAEASAWRIQAAPGAMALIGILLVIAGFITDLLGVALLVPPLRQWLGAFIQKALASPQAGRPDAIIDLAPDEWRDVTKTKPRKKRAPPRR